MPVRYRLYYDDVMSHKDAIGTGKLIEIEVMDMESKSWFPTRSLISQQPMEGGEPAALVSRVARVVEEGEWFIKIVERIEEEEEEGITIFVSKRAGERRGYMLKSMMAEQKAKLKQETMTEELESRLKRKQEIVEEVLEEQKDES